MPYDSTDALDKVLHLTALVATDLARFERDSGLTQARTRVLWILGTEGPSTQRSLATTLDVSPRNVTGLVDGLVRQGYVTRTPHPADRRATLVVPTTRGAGVIADLRASHEDLAHRLFGDVPPRRLTAFVTTLDQSIATFAALMEEDA